MVIPHGITIKCGHVCSWEQICPEHILLAVLLRISTGSIRWVALQQALFAGCGVISSCTEDIFETLKDMFSLSLSETIWYSSTLFTPAACGALVMHVPETYTQAQWYFLSFILLLVAPNSLLAFCCQLFWHCQWVHSSLKSPGMRMSPPVYLKAVYLQVFTLYSICYFYCGAISITLYIIDLILNHSHKQ